MSRLVALAGLALAGTLLSPAPSYADSPPTPTACPASVAEVADCWTGQDANGAFYAIAVPHDWNGDLVVHSHGGPDLDDPTDASRSLDDLDRWAVMPREGYAWVGSAYRRGGFGTRMAVADTEGARLAFEAAFGEPERTFAHGQSWGGDVAAKLVEVHPTTYDGVLLTNGVLAGASRGYDYRVDLRVVYQYYCGNHPRPSEPQYPLWQGLRADSTMTSTGLRARLQECTGIESAPADRTPLQQRNLDDILAVTKVPERTLSSHLSFATFTFRDIVHDRLGGRNPFSNLGVRYSGSHDDRALNRGVERFVAHPRARRDLMWDSDLTGAVSIPTLDLHALDTWVTTGEKPTPASVAASCPDYDATYATGCFIDPAFTPASYDSRVNARLLGRHWPTMPAWLERAWSHVPGIGIAP
ncbi:hypothetical protein SAMN04489844_1638 [Nocardioides exalbidus]|uniref:Secretory lipase n=1 Tax=Nocardioides exalbidus TaxID=402596 RepID=A0A1H4PL78_9ACTN|nr:hypothetical protein [Nocardioides exalbidus]SEC08041.1 hypothetical protein SAMN04489844_1638 [Nocardioides exalbidus]